MTAKATVQTSSRRRDQIKLTDDFSVTQFLDTAEILVSAGRGGRGSAWLRREKYVPRGGPAGGDGGRGGHVLLRARAGENTLLRFRFERRFRAGHGGPGGRNRSTGAQGEDLFIDVPCGTVVLDADADEFRGDLIADGQTLQVARGGDGGFGNMHFKSSRNQTPRMALKGEPGESRKLRLELKLMADVGLAGAPNAGKSSLLAALSAAKPLVAAFPFSTKHPVLGVVRFRDRQLVFADAPGLIAGSHLGHGLGHEFLRNLERTRFLVQVVDLSGESGDPLEAYRQVRGELQSAPVPLHDRPYIVAANKMDTASARAAWPAFERSLSQMGVAAYPISAVTGAGLRELLAAAFSETQRAPRPALAQASMPVLRPAATVRPLVIESIGEGQFAVTGAFIDSLTERVDFRMPDALAWYWRQLDREGVMTALRRAGVRAGDQVQIAGRAFEWHEG